MQPLPVFNPYAQQLRFLSDRLRTRRDHEKYLLLIDALAVLFQHQRERRRIAATIGRHARRRKVKPRRRAIGRKDAGRSGSNIGLHLKPRHAPGQPDARELEAHGCR